MKRQVVQTNLAAHPRGWYSQAIRANNFLFVSGITAIDPASGQIVAPGDIVAQTSQVLENMNTILQAGKSSLKHVVKTTVFIDNIDKFPLFNDVYKEFFPLEPPARSTVQVGRFANGLCIEIDAIAICEE